DVTMTVGSAKKLPANTFTKKGYHFAGWSTENDNVVKFTDKQSVKDLNAGGAKGAVLFAVWEENTYTVTYNGNGGKFSDGKKNCKQTLKYGETETLRVQGEFKRTGYTFVGWSTSKKAKYAEYKDGSSVRNLSSKNNGNVNLYAVWKVNTYSIVFLSDEDSDGYETYGIVDTMVVPYGKSVKLNRNIMEFDGYCFTGWKCSNGKTYKDGATVKNLSSQPNGLVIMEPTWKDHIYTVKFNINGASGKTPDPITCSSSKDRVTIPKATGLEFAGGELIYWSTKPDGTGRIFDIYGDFSYRMSDKNVKYKKTITLYAVWRYEVNLDPGVGEGNIQKETRIWNSSQAIENPGFSKKGYKLVGWNTDKAKAENGTALKSVKNLPVDCTLYAVWVPIKYKICFIYGDYGVKDVYQTLTYGKETALSANKFKSKGRTFAGWEYYDANKGETVVYQNKDKVLNLTDVDGEVLDFYAKWDYIKYNITYVLPQGAVNPSSNPTYYIINQQYSYEGFDLENPTMDGYTFKGWYKDSKYKKKFDGLEPDQIGALKLYAKFVKN
ncbi:MAG: InlB B-repeat-containing protein, partial [Lachnospiraceae bacterium]|nr:InlB B-repeat-containing protein [Lachnospiraceae bacterium]